MESALSFKGSILFSEAVMKKIRMLTTASLALVTFLAGGGVMKAVSAEADYESLRRFDLPLSPQGTQFQRRGWEELRRIGWGSTRSYGEVARAAGSPRGARAVGMACNRNPLLIVVPCHRVVGADGSLVGYGGGLELKRRLLELERVLLPLEN